MPGRAWQVKEGSGQGQVHSGELADWTFFDKAESTILTKEARQTHGVKLWLRYRDDGFMIAGKAKENMVVITQNAK